MQSFERGRERESTEVVAKSRLTDVGLIVRSTPWPQSLYRATTHTGLTSSPSLTHEARLSLHSIPFTVHRYPTMDAVNNFLKVRAP